MVKKTTEAPAAPATSAPADPAPDLWPAVLSALMGLATAMVAVSRFPHQPVPVALTARVETAQRDLADAVAAAGGASPSIEGGMAAAYDDAWIKSAFEGLNAALKTRFEEEAQARAAEVKAVLDGLPDLIDQRIAAAAAQAADPA